jgi:hypothetical protein
VGADPHVVLDPDADLVEGLQPDRGVEIVEAVVEPVRAANDAIRTPWPTVTQPAMAT